MPREQLEDVGLVFLQEAPLAAIHWLIQVAVPPRVGREYRHGLELDDGHPVDVDGYHLLVELQNDDHQLVEA